MTGILVKNFADRKFCSALCDVLQKFIDGNVVIVRIELIEDPGRGNRALVFWYSKVSEGVASRQAGKRDEDIPKYPIEVNVSIWNTHVDTDLILAKFALVR
ncbi:hypothetical protein PQI07_22655 [Methylobacterium sp. 092160098-2]|uniref:hypothetical protein n=1 Tax=Methylobacterium sp. 092160098-2 TaxID=3025129 RepID=UPI002381A27E|nr:hypothetical protein [Methylobacterium sp. 092160098-2]MDE4913485.1 hypothetical protein [Methylobacterium sp. 092160098-2]